VQSIEPGSEGKRPEIYPYISATKISHRATIFMVKKYRYKNNSATEITGKKMIYGYARVSTSEQETTLQIDALKRAGVRKIFQEKRSGVASRPVLADLLGRLTPADTIKVYKIDRFARSLIDLLSILQKIETAKASFQSLTEPIDTRSGAGRMMMHMLGAFAEFERGIIRERTMAGQLAARERGIHCGRPRSLTKIQESDVVKMYASGWYTLETLAYAFDCHPSVIKRAVYRINKPGHSSLK